MEGEKGNLKSEIFVYLSAYVNVNLNTKIKYNFSVESNFFSQRPASDSEWNLFWKANFILDKIYMMENISYMLSFSHNTSEYVLLS